MTVFPSVPFSDSYVLYKEELLCILYRQQQGDIHAKGIQYMYSTRNCLKNACQIQMRCWWAYLPATPPQGRDIPHRRHPMQRQQPQTPSPQDSSRPFRHLLRRFSLSVTFQKSWVTKEKWNEGKGKKSYFIAARKTQENVWKYQMLTCDSSERCKPLDPAQPLTNEKVISDSKWVSQLKI